MGINYIWKQSTMTENCENSRQSGAGMLQKTLRIIIRRTPNSIKIEETEEMPDEFYEIFAIARS